MKHYTTIEQSKKLLELGLNSETADFEYKCVGFTMHTTRPTDDFKYNVMPKEQNIPHEQIYDVPCWSTGMLLDLMPSFISKSSKIYNFRCDKDNALYYILSYDRIGTIMKLPISEVVFYSKTLVDACFEMISWLLENHYIKGKWVI